MTPTESCWVRPVGDRVFMEEESLTKPGSPGFPEKETFDWPLKVKAEFVRLRAGKGTPGRGNS